ncbi:MAG: DUF11 domain-containing protein [Caldilineaceae bacterium]|nr:DUF11 domain-containing protein [Caldilineaceae bacterium]
MIALSKHGLSFYTQFSLFLSFTATTLASLLFVALSSTLYAANTAPIQIFFVPLPEDQIRTAFLQTASGVSATMHSVVGISITANDTLIYYDHWENGYDADIANPTNLYSATNPGGTQIWGDGDPTNGAPPGITSDRLNAGTIIVLENDITIPRSPATIRYDGRDKLGATKVTAMAKSAWATTPGTVLADAVEAIDTTRWGTTFTIPIGQNLNSSAIFEYVSLLVMAGEDGTLMQIDSDGDGTVDITQTLSQGQSYQVNGGINSGARVTTSKPVQVNLLTGDIGATYESRWFTIPPTNQWGSSYYTPVGTTSTSYPATVWLYNDNPSTITVAYETKAGTGTFTIAAGDVYRFTMPLLSGAHFYTTDGRPFAALGTMDSTTNSSANQTYDWGYTLVTDAYLTGAFTVGWAPGTADGSGNGSPVWVTSVKPTTIYVDYDGNPATGALTDPQGRKYDVAYSLTAFESKQIYDPDKDQTGMRVYSLDGTVLTGVWGEDPSRAQAGNPYLDVGYSIPPLPQAVVEKKAAVVGDSNANQLLDPGEMLEYTLTTRNLGVVTLFNAIVSDTLPAEVTYVVDSTLLNGAPVADNAGPTRTLFPLDEGGLNIGTLLVGETFTLTFQALAKTFPPVYNQITNVAEVDAGGEAFTALNQMPVNTGMVTQCALAFVDSSGASVNIYQENSTLYLRLTDGDQNRSNTISEVSNVVIQNSATGDRETVALTETTVNSGLFAGSLPLSTTAGSALEDGTLKASAGHPLQVNFVDSTFGDSCRATAQITVPALVKPLYLSSDGIGSPDQDLDRIDPVATNDSTTATTAVLNQGAGAIAVEATSKANSNAANTLTFAHTTGNGANRLLLVAVAVGSSTSTGGNATTVSSVTYGGTSLTLVGSISESGSRVRSYLYSLLAPPTGTANVVVTLSSSATRPLYAGATTFTGVNQSAPLGTYASYRSGTSVTSTSLAVTSASGELVYDAVAVDGESNSNIALTVGSNQTARWTTNSTNYLSAGSSTKAGATSTTMAWSWSSSNQYVIGAVPIKPAPAEASTSFTLTPALCSALALPVGGAINVTTYVNVTSGTMPANPNVSATLKYGATTLATLSNPTYNSTTGALSWTGAVASNITIPAGQALGLTIASNQSNVSFTIQYDSSSKPSQIKLPTTTVIDITDFALYDAPYPGGNRVTDATNGQTLYIRTTVSDPFGPADIRQVDVMLTAPTGGTTTIPLTSAIATSGCTKSYEYTWNTSVVQGQYNIAVTAWEGYETGAAAVTDQASTPFTLNFQDTGTPSKSEFTSGNNGAVTTSYNPNPTVCVRVTDIDQNTNATVAETITAVIKGGGNDSESVTLTETGPDTGIFTACLPASSSSTGSSNNGTLYAPMGSSLTITYVDPTDSSDSSTATAVVTTLTPSISLNKNLVTPSDGVAVVGEMIRFDLVVGNPGITTLTSITVVDTFPNSCLRYQSASITPSSVVTPTLQWQVGPLATGASQTISLYFVATAPCTPATNQATVSATDQNNQSISAGPVTAAVTTTKPGLILTKSRIAPASGSPQIGEIVTFQLALLNSGSSTITTLPLGDNYSAGCLAYTSASPAPDAAAGGAVLWNNLGPLAAGATRTVTVNFTVVGGCNPTANLADVSAAVDQYGDPVPPVQSSASLTTLSASIGDLVWYDQNNDGQYQAGEPGLAGIVVALSLPNSTVVTTTTDLNGYYTFAQLPAGSYSVTVLGSSLPTGYALTTQQAAWPITLNAGAMVTTADFGYHPRGVVAGTVYQDVDGDGQYTALIDTVLPHISLTITDTNGTRYTVQTDSNGHYSQIVAAGVTQVHLATEQLPAGMLLAQDTANPAWRTVPAGGSAIADFPYVPPLQLDKDSLTPTVVAGTTATYTIQLHNSSAYTLTNVVISDTLPLSFTYATSSIVQAQASRTSTSNPTSGATHLTWGSWRLQPGGAITVTVRVAVHSSTLAGRYDNTARASSTQTGIIDDDGTLAQDSHTPYGQDPTSDDDVTVTTQAALAVRKDDLVDPIAAGERLTYTIMVTNSGPSDAVGVVITDTLPSGTTFYAASGNCSVHLAQIHCTLGTLPAGAVRTITIVVTLDPSFLARPAKAWLAFVCPPHFASCQPQDTPMHIVLRQQNRDGPFAAVRPEI